MPQQSAKAMEDLHKKKEKLEKEKEKEEVKLKQVMDSLKTETQVLKYINLHCICMDFINIIHVRHNDRRPSLSKTSVSKLTVYNMTLIVLTGVKPQLIQSIKSDKMRHSVFHWNCSGWHHCKLASSNSLLTYFYDHLPNACGN